MNLREERIRRGLTLPQLAEIVGVPYQTVRRAEMGRPIREDSAKRIADFLGVDPLTLVLRPDESKQEAA